MSLKTLEQESGIIRLSLQKVHTDSTVELNKSRTSQKAKNSDRNLTWHQPRPSDRDGGGISRLGRALESRIKPEFNNILCIGDNEDRSLKLLRY